jgi:hypothetical protein
MAPNLYEIVTLDHKRHFNEYLESEALAFAEEVLSRRYEIQDAFLEWAASNGVVPSHDYVRDYVRFAELVASACVLKKDVNFVPSPYRRSDDYPVLLDRASQLLCLGLSIHFANEIEKVFAGTFRLGIVTWNPRHYDRGTLVVLVCPPETYIPILTVPIDQIKGRFRIGSSFSPKFLDVARLILARQRGYVQGPDSERRLMSAHDPKKEWLKKQKAAAKRLERKNNGQ